MVGTLDKKLFTKAMSVEKEADVMLDHDYDGIQGTDNHYHPGGNMDFISPLVWRLFTC